MGSLMNRFIMPAVKRVTLPEIARLAGCSKAVVSTVLNHSRGNTAVGSELRRRVEEVAREVGYVPNFASRSLARGNTSTLGVYIPPGPWSGIGAGYESQILRGVEGACQHAGYDVLILNLAGDSTPEMCMAKVAEQRVDGVLVVHARSESPGLQELIESGTHVLAVDYSQPTSEMDAVVFDNAAGMELAVTHLAGLGHRRIGYIGTCLIDPGPDDRIRRSGLIAAMSKLGLPLDERWANLSSPGFCELDVPGGHCRLAGITGVNRIVEMGDDAPTAVVAYSDLVALSAMQRLAELGKPVPKSLSIVGFDDSPACTLVWPELTSIRHPLEEMGRHATELLIARARAGKQEGRRERAPVERVVFKPELMVRGTTTMHRL